MFSAKLTLSGFGVTFFRLLSCFSSLFTPFSLPRSSSPPHSVHLLFVLTTIFFTLSLVFSRSFSQSEAPLFTRSRQISCTDFSVKITLFQLLALTHNRTLYFAPVLLPFMKEIINALAPTLPCRRTCEKNLFSGYLDGHFCFFFFVVTHSFRQQNQHTLTPSMTMTMTVWQVC